jgi:hypothetical protein
MMRRPITFRFLEVSNARIGVIGIARIMQSITSPNPSLIANETF